MGGRVSAEVTSEREDPGTAKQSSKHTVSLNTDD